MGRAGPWVGNAQTSQNSLFHPPACGLKQSQEFLRRLLLVLGLGLRARTASGKKSGGKFEKFPAQKEDLMQNWSFKRKKLWMHELCEVDWMTPDCFCLLISLIRRKRRLSLLLRAARAARSFALLSNFQMFNWHLLRDVVMHCSPVSVSKLWKD